MIKAKKSLGQNFLIDKNIINKIIEIIDIKDKSILEVGPGTGNLTKFLLQKKPKKFYVVEKDDRIAQLILEKIETPEMIMVDSLEDTERGSGGFGSTGV